MRGVRVLVAPDCFGSSLTSAQATSTVVDAWRTAAPHDEVTGCPLSDGGPGFVETLRTTLGGELVAVTVPGPLGDPAPAAVLVVDDERGRTAYVESAHAVGLPLVPAERRDPTRTTTRGLGELLAAARATGAGRVVVGLGGSATNDAGAGLLVGLGHPDPRGVLAHGGGALVGVRPDDLGGLRALRDAWRGVELLVATDVDVPLLGLQGASAGFAPQKGATPEQAQDLERALATFSRAAVDALGADLRPDLLAGAAGAAAAAKRLTHAPGAGAAGGLGFGLALLGGRVVPGAALVADTVGLDARIAASDLVVTGEGRFDWQSLHGKVAALVAQRALPYAVPTIVVAGQVEVGRREWAAAGLAGAYAVADRDDLVAAALADPTGTLAARVARVARTWSPA
ncbi:glycerate kinase family protein [Cellulomonas palmilytica]|uniref:glycerate kinase family protein n=1 Tax=Cellulomonas palmilytica TaxID=2608402 RepID=UPI001F1E2AD9|nr:glycerate kinase [Cellulomonas palmilytica]UJP39228.1 glycerate kinase [Cellulomonas palmilytica]